MNARCPYPECAAEFPAADADDWHWPSGDCPACGRPATFRPSEVYALLARRRVPERPSAVCERMALLEDVRSIWNVGSIFRSADGAGFGRLILCGVSGTPPHKDLAKTSLGAEQVVAWEYAQGALEPLRRLKAQGVFVLGLERCPGSEPLDAVSPPVPFCLVVGNEVMGLSAETLAQCDRVGHLPMRGVKASLNVAVAFGIAAYQLAAHA